MRERAIQVVPWIAFSALLAGMCDYFSEAFMLSKKALQRALLLLVPVITSLSLNVLLLPKFGLIGAAYANVAAYGLGMTMLAWFVSPWLFMLMSSGVVLVLYRREFHSDVLQVMVYTQTDTTAPDTVKETA